MISLLEAMHALRENEEIIENPETMQFNGETLKFDREEECDWCGRETLVGVTHYGSTHYNRLICKRCAEEIKNRNKKNFGVNEDIDDEDEEIDWEAEEDAEEKAIEKLADDVENKLAKMTFKEFTNDWIADSDILAKFTSQELRLIYMLVTDVPARHEIFDKLAGMNFRTYVENEVMDSINEFGFSDNRDAQIILCANELLNTILNVYTERAIDDEDDSYIQKAIKNCPMLSRLEDDEKNLLINAAIKLANYLI